MILAKFTFTRFFFSESTRKKNFEDLRRLCEYLECSALPFSISSTVGTYSPSYSRLSPKVDVVILGAVNRSRRNEAP